MEKSHSPDMPLLGLSCALVALGIIILGSVSASFSLEKTGNTFYFLSHQLLAGLLPGLFFAFLAYRIKVENFKHVSFFLLFGSTLLLLFVFFPVIGGQIKGAYRWIDLGPISFQPSELLKPAFILYAAAWLSNRSGEKTRNKFFIPFVGVLILIALLLLLQRDVSTLGIIALTGVAMYFLAGMPFSHTLLMIFGGMGLLALMVKLAPYRFSRLLVFLNPNLDPLGQGYHVKQALIGIGSGGITGVGLGLSFQKFGMLPEPISDSIFAVFAEEAGLVGALILIFLFIAFAWRVFTISKKIHDPFSKLAALGIASWITLQAFLNIASMVGIFPLAGIPLPFVSYGGSALVSELIGVGLLLNISKQAA